MNKLKISHRRGIILIFLAILGSSNSARADSNSDLFRDKTLAADLAFGFPQFLGLDLTLIKFPYIAPGIGFGVAPVAGLLKNAVKLESIPLDLSLPNSYQVNPAADFSLTSFSVYLKSYLPDSGFFGQLLFSSVSFQATISGSLQNTTTGAVASNVISGTASLTQWIVGLLFGYQLRLGSQAFVEFALGAGYLLPPKYSISIGGSVSSLIGILPSGNELDQAMTEIKADFDTAVNSYRNTIRVTPLTFLNVGIVF